MFKKNYNKIFIPKNVKEVLIEMFYQLGEKNTLKFKKFNNHIKKKYYYLAAFEMMKSRWYKQTPNRVDGLIKILINKNVKKR